MNTYLVGDSLANNNYFSHEISKNEKSINQEKVFELCMNNNKNSKNHPQQNKINNISVKYKESSNKILNKNLEKHKLIKETNLKAGNKLDIKNYLSEPANLNKNKILNNDKMISSSTMSIVKKTLNNKDNSSYKPNIMSNKVLLINESNSNRQAVRSYRSNIETQLLAQKNKYNSQGHSNSNLTLNTSSVTRKPAIKSPTNLEFLKNKSSNIFSNPNNILKNNRYDSSENVLSNRSNNNRSSNALIPDIVIDDFPDNKNLGVEIPANSMNPKDQINTEDFHLLQKTNFVVGKHSLIRKILYQSNNRSNSLNNLENSNKFLSKRLINGKSADNLLEKNEIILNKRKIIVSLERNMNNNSKSNYILNNISYSNSNLNNSVKQKIKGLLKTKSIPLIDKNEKINSDLNNSKEMDINLLENNLVINGNINNMKSTYKANMLNFINNNCSEATKVKNASTGSNKHSIIKSIKINSKNEATNNSMNNNNTAILEINKNLPNKKKERDIPIPMPNLKNLIKNNCNKKNFIDRNILNNPSIANIGSIDNTNNFKNKSSRLNVKKGYIEIEISSSSKDSFEIEECSNLDAKIVNENILGKLNYTDELDFDDVNSVVKKLNLHNIPLKKENIFTEKNNTIKKYGERFNHEFQKNMMYLFERAISRGYSTTIKAKNSFQFKDKSLSTEDTSSKKTASPTNIMSRLRSDNFEDGYTDKVNLFNVYLSKLK